MNSIENANVLGLCVCERAFLSLLFLLCESAAVYLVSTHLLRYLFDAFPHTDGKKLHTHSRNARVCVQHINTMSRAADLRDT